MKIKKRLLHLGPDATVALDAPHENPAPRRQRDLPSLPRDARMEGWIA